MAERVAIHLTAEDRTRAAFVSAQRNLRTFNRSLEFASRLFVGAFSTIGIVRLTGAIAEAGIAMQRFERGLRAATGSSALAQRELGFVRDEAERLGLDFASAAQQFTKLTAAARGTALAGQQARDIFTAVSEASRVLGLSAEQTGGALTAIEQIISKGRVSAEELRGQLGERLPGAFQIAARSIGVTTAELDKMLKQGELGAERLLPALAAELRKTFGPEVESAARDAQSSFTRLTNAIFDLKASVADSGLLDALAAMARGVTTLTDAFTGFSIGAIPDDIDELQGKLRDLREQFEALPESARAGGFGEALLRAIRELDQALLERTFTNVERVGDSLELVDFTSFNTGADKMARLLRPLNERLAELGIRLEDVGQVQLAEIDLSQFNTGAERMERLMRPLSERLGELGIELEELPERAEAAVPAFADFARSLGFAFSDTLADALLGADRAFDDMLRRLAARLAADQLTRALFGFLGGLGGQVGSFFSGIQGFQHGGFIAAGRVGVVGERGPELVLGPARIQPLAGGLAPKLQVTVVNNAAPMARVETRQRGPTVIEVVVDSVLNELGRGRADAALSARYGLRPSVGLR